jgi:hypothetical protein
MLYPSGQETAARHSSRPGDMLVLERLDMGLATTRGGRLAKAVLLAFLIAGLAWVASARPPFARATTLAATAPTPGPGAMTIYAVTNQSTVTLNLQHIFSDSSGFYYSFTSQIPPSSTVEYHVKDMPQVPSPFQGSLTLRGDQSFTAQIVGYDYPSVTPTATASTAATVIPTVTPTATTGASTTPTRTSTPLPTATPTRSPTPAAISTPLFTSGFEASSFSADGWSLDVAGSGATAQLITSPVWSGSQAARFSTQTQQSGQHAFADARFSWPSSNLLSAHAFIQPQVSSIQYYAKILGLETAGPSNWVTRAAFELGPSTFVAAYTSRDGTMHHVDTHLAYQSNQWYDLTVTADYRGPNPVFSFLISGQTVYSVTDTSTGSSTDRPAFLAVGFGPGSWGTNAGSIIADQVSLASGQ